MTRDLRDYAKSTSVHLAVGALLILFIVGLGLIGWIYGIPAAMMGFVCLLGALVPIGLIYLSLQILDWISKRADRD